MELIKKNIHMDRIKCKASTQVTLEDDRNVPDQKPDMNRIILHRGEVKTEEIKTEVVTSDTVCDRRGDCEPHGGANSL